MSSTSRAILSPQMKELKTNLPTSGKLLDKHDFAYQNSSQSLRNERILINFLHSTYIFTIQTVGVPISVRREK